MKTIKRRIAALLALMLLMTVLLGCQPKNAGVTDDGIVLPEIEEVPKEATEINVLDYGVDNTGGKDMTGLLTALHNKSAELGLPVYYPNGTYLFNGSKLDFSGGVQFESTDQVVVRNANSEQSVFAFDNKGNFIGLMQNHLELQYGQDGWRENGSLVSPPKANLDYETKVDVLAYWYNDFGLQSTALGGGRNGWIGNYDWRWNHSDCASLGTDLIPYDPYNPNVHPLLGYYRGDDPVVLDWICYWLQEYGVRQTAPFVGVGLNTKLWDDPACGYHWVYQLLNHTPNAKTMDFAMFVESSSYSAVYDRVKNSWWRTFEAFYFNETYSDMVYCYEDAEGKRYPVVMVWDETSFVYSWDDPTYLVDLYTQSAQAFIEAGYDGVCIVACKSAADMFMTQLQKLDMYAKGVRWMAADYPSNAVGNAHDYPGLVNNFFQLQQTERLYGVATGLDSHISHDSQYSWINSTPYDFARWIARAVEATRSVESRAQIITCYNVSEWTEGGVSLIPTVGNRFAYLEALRSQIVVGEDDTLAPPEGEESDSEEESEEGDGEAESEADDKTDKDDKKDNKK